MATTWIILLQHILECHGVADLIRDSVVLSNKVPEKGVGFLLKCYSNGRMWGLYIFNPSCLGCYCYSNIFEYT